MYCLCFLFTIFTFLRCLESSFLILVTSFSTSSTSLCQSPGQYIYQHWRVVTSPQKGIYVLYIKIYQIYICIYMYLLIPEVLRIDVYLYIYIVYKYIYIYVCSYASTLILFILRHPCHFKALNVLLTKLGIGPVFMPWQLQYLKLHQCSHPCHTNLADWYQDLFPMPKREGAESESRSSGTGTLLGIFKLERLIFNDWQVGDNLSPNNLIW